MTPISACLITFNEERNLSRALASLQGIADEIIVVDAGSSDRTREIAQRFGARVFARPWTNYSEQKNFAASLAAHDWVLSLDADEELGPELREALLRWKDSVPQAAACRFARRAYYLGGWVRHSGWYPDYQVRLYLRHAGCFAGALHESVRIAAAGKRRGPELVATLPGELRHYTMQTAAEHRQKIEVYTDIAAQQLLAAGARPSLAAMWLGPAWAFFRTFVLRAGFLDGPRGWLIARMAARYVWLKYRKLAALRSADASRHQ